MSPRPLLLAASVLLLGGCNKLVGGILADTTGELVLPKVMSLGDVDMGCAAGEALGGMILAYGDYSPKAKQASILTEMSAAMCTDPAIWEAQLEGARALHAGDVATAKDAAAREKRAQYVAAERYLLAHQALLDAYGTPQPDGECPKLKHESDQLSYLLGLSSGVLAVLNDLSIGGAVGVPMSFPAGVERAGACLDDDTWWGVPTAMRASVWAIQPDNPDFPDAWEAFDASVVKGEAAHVRLATAFATQTAATIGDEAKVRDLIRRHAAAVAESDSDPKYAMLDRYASRLVLHESDKIWTAAVGHRTPWGELGTFPDDVAEDDVMLDDDLLGDLLE